MSLNPFQIRVVIQTLVKARREAVSFSLNPFQIRVVIQTVLDRQNEAVHHRLNPFQIRVVIQTRGFVIGDYRPLLSQSLSDQGSHSDLRRRIKATGR